MARPAFRFTQAEVAEMEAILQEHSNAMPPRDVLRALAVKFSESTDRKGKITVQMKQVLNWFKKRRSRQTPGKSNTTPMPLDDKTPVRSMPQQPTAAPIPATSASVPTAVKAAPENSVLEFEAKSGRDGAWYDVAIFLNIRNLETSDLEVLVRLSGFRPEEDEWINIPKHVRPRSLPCESSECVAVIPGDLILCYQECQEQALYFDAHILDVHRRRHDIRGCRCRFFVRFDHDQSEEIVPLRKICRRPETNYRLQLHALNEAAPVDQQNTGMDAAANVNVMRATTTETVPKQLIESNIHMETPVMQTNVPQPPQSMDIDVVQKKAETKTDVQAGNSIITPGSAPFTNITTSRVPEVSSQTQNMVE